MTTVLLASLLGSLWTVAAVLDAPPSSYLLAWFGIVLALTDLRHHRLPDALTLPLGALLLLLQFHRLGAAACTALIFGGAHLAIRTWRPQHMGGGDVKLAAALGTALTLSSLLPAAILSSAVTLAIAAIKRRRAVPHGPGLLAATWALTTL